MGAFITWCGFFGAWLLFAGPIYQAALELQEQDLRRDELEAFDSLVTPPPPVSPWWWLVPPVYYLKHRKRSRIMRQSMMEALTPQQLQSLVEYFNKATGWFLVAGGGLLIATKETWELVEHYEWPVWLFWFLIVLMAGLAFLNLSVRLRRSHALLGGGQDEAGSSAFASEAPPGGPAPA